MSREVWPGRPFPVGATWSGEATNFSLFSENATAVELLDDFSMARAVNLGLLLRLPEAAFNRVGLHSERGEESIRALVILMAGHDRVHVEQVKRLLALLPKKTVKKAAPKKKLK